MALTTDINVSVLERGGTTTIPVYVNSLDDGCDSSERKSEIGATQWSGCIAGGDGLLYNRWVIDAEVVYEDTPSKFIRPISLYYGESGTLIFVVGRGYMRYMPDDGSGMQIEATITNDTNHPKTIIVQGVWLDDNTPISDGARFILNPMQSTKVRLSDVGVGVAVGAGIAPTAVVYE